MKVAIDTNILSWMLSNASRPPVDKTTGSPLVDGPLRLKELKRRISNDEIEPLVVSTVVAGEFYSVEPNAINNFRNIINDPLIFSLQVFGEKAAIELADVNNKYYASGDKKAGQAGTWAKIKGDRMIFAVAKACNVQVMYTDDKGLAAVCEDNGITVVRSWELPLPESEQRTIFDE